MKKIIISLLLCSLPLVAVAQINIQEAEKKAEIAQKLNAPAKAVLGLGAILSTISTIFYSSQHKQAKADAQKIEKELYPWIKGLFEGTSSQIVIKSPIGLYKRGRHPFINDNHPKSGFKTHFPKLVKLGFFDRDMILSIDSQFPIREEGYDDVNMSQFFNKVDAEYNITTVYARDVGVQYYKFLEKYASDDDFNKANPKSIYNDIVRPQLIKGGMSAAAFVGCVVGLIAFNRYYENSIKKVEELKSAQVAEQK